jgi:branched-chain amino acid transport system permease protein
VSESTTGPGYPTEGTALGEVDAPRIGVDEWVASAEGRQARRGGALGALRRGIDRIPQIVRLAIFVGLVALIPAITTNEYILRVTTDTLLYVLLALGLNVAVGWAGLLDLGYIAFYGFAAYGFAMLSSSKFGVHWPTWAVVPLVIAATVLLGFLLALPSRRLVGDYLAIVTLFFGVMFVTVTTQGYRVPWFGKEVDITGGPTGITNVDPWRLFGSDLTQVRDYLYIALVCVAIVAVVLYLVNTSRTGRGWRAFREDALAAEVMSMPINWLKLLAIAVGAGVAGVAGCINASYYQGVFPTSFDTPVLITIYAMVILGGAGSLTGVVIGAVLLNVGLEVLRTPDHARWVFYLVIFGALVAKIRPWRVLAAVLGGLVVFGVVVNQIVAAVWPRGVAGPLFTGGVEFTKSGWLAQALRHWLVLPANTYTVPDYRIGNYAFVLLVVLALTLTLLRGWVFYVLLVPTVWLAAFVWENRLVEEAPTTRPLLLGAILVVMMAARPQGLLGTPRVEIT